jgi:hypothetical protein
MLKNIKNARKRFGGKDFLIKKSDLDLQKSQ